MIEIQRMLIAGLVVALAAGCVVWLRSRGFVRLAGVGTKRRWPRRLELVERLPLSAHHSLHLVRMGARLILLGRSPSGITLLETAEWREPGEEIAQ